MKINEVIRFTFKDENINFSQLQHVYSYEDTLQLYETFLLKEGNLLETNSDKSVEFFKNLKNMSDEPVQGEKSIVCFLTLVNDQIHRAKTVEVLTFLQGNDDSLTFKDSNDNTVTYPLMYVGNSLMNTFCFSSTSSYDKFRNVVSLKFGTMLPSIQINEAATAGSTNTGSMGGASIPNPHLSPGKARGKSSYTGTPGKSGTKAPPQPKPKKQSPTDNALNMKGTSIFGAPLKRE